MTKLKLSGLSSPSSPSIKAVKGTDVELTLASAPPAPPPPLSRPGFPLAATESSLKVKWAGLMALRAFTASAAPGRTSHV